MSMIMVLERVGEGARVENSKPVAVSEKHFEPSPLKLFNGELDDDPTEAEGLLPAMTSTFPSDVNGITNFSNEFDEDAADSATLCLEKAWHGLHFLLTGDSWGGVGPEAFLVGGGVEQDDDYGYGPSRYFTAQETREIAKALSRTDVDDLWSRYDAQAMTQAGIYPDIWDEAVDDLEEEYCEYFEELQVFLAEAAEQGDALLVYLT